MKSIKAIYFLLLNCLSSCYLTFISKSSIIPEKISLLRIFRNNMKKNVAISKFMNEMASKTIPLSFFFRNDGINRNKAISFFCCLLLIQIAFGQDNYFQQRVAYKIDVKLNDSLHTLSAFETIEYKNNSPRELNFIYFHLWPNAYKNNETALAKQLFEDRNFRLYYSEEKDRGFIDSLDFKVNNKPIKWQLDSQHIDICKLILNTPLQPGESIKITTPFYVKIPKGVYSRLGHLGQAYQITQWYPKPAVYDKNGWHEMPYLSQGEFYSEFGSFDVSITLPENYVVGATGDLVNGEKELTWLNQKAAETDSLIKKDSIPTTDTIPKSSKQWKTLHYHQDNVHDFAWFTDKRWQVLKGEVELPHSKRKVTTWAMFTNSQFKLWKKAIEYLNDAIYYYSLWNGDYAYNHMTAVDGALTAGAGMEYPNITVIGPSNGDYLHEAVIMHETGHQWFYGMLGSNERDHAWLDEGINSANESRYFETKYPDSLTILGFSRDKFYTKLFDLNRPHRESYYTGYLLSARKNLDQPMELPSEQFTSMNYGEIVYYKSATVFNYLRAYLGDEQYDKAMQAYFDTWKFKHPQPEDLQKIIEEITKDDLNWFFKDIIKTTGKIDYKITSVNKTGKGQYGVELKNVGDINSPVSISALRGDTVIFTQWLKGFSDTQTLSIAVDDDVDQIKIDAEQKIPEIVRSNNTINTKGLFKKSKPLKFAGSLAVHYNLFSKKTFEQVKFGIKSSSYAFDRFGDRQANFYKIVPEAIFTFKRPNLRKRVYHKIHLRSINIRENYPSINHNNSFQEIAYLFSDFRGLSPSNVDIVLQHGFLTTENKSDIPLNNVQSTDTDFLRASLEAYKRLPLRQGKYVTFRFFAGMYLFNNTNHPRYNWRMDGISGYRDYTYDYIFLGRTENEGVLSQQFIENQGGFKISTPVGQSNKWITAFNFKSDIPGKIPIRVYGDVGFTRNEVFDVQSLSVSMENVFLFNGGLNIQVIPTDILDIYIPLVYSTNITDVPSFQSSNFIERIRFTLNLHFANPFDIVSF